MEDSSQVRHIPAFGRPYELGMLYDSYSEQVIPGRFMWTQDKIDEARLTTQKQKNHTGSRMASGDSFEEKNKNIDLDGNLELSVLTGMVRLEGSAKRLYDTIKSSRQKHVTFESVCETKYEQLPIDVLGTTDFPDTLASGHATHVVAGIQYGVKAVLSFTEEETSDETNLKQSLAGSLDYKSTPTEKGESTRTEKGESTSTEKGESTPMEKGKSLTPRKKGESTRTEKGESNSEITVINPKQTEGTAQVTLKKNVGQKKVQYVLHSDIKLTMNPTTYDEVINLCKDIPNQLGSNQEQAVPLEVCLHPLNVPYNQISGALVNRIGVVLKELDEIQNRCNDLDACCCKSFPGQIEILSNCIKMFKTFTVTFKESLSKIIQDIRRGRLEEKMLDSYLTKADASPFGYQALKTWLNKQEEKIVLVNNYMEAGMKDIHVCKTEAEFSTRKHGIEHTYCLCFIFRLSKVDKHDEQLAAMKLYLEKKYDSEAEMPEVTTDLFSEQPSRDLVRNVKSFIGFARANKGGKTLFTVVEQIATSGSLGGFMKLYKEGELVDPHFKPPSKPGKPSFTTVTSFSAAFKWKVPDSGNNTFTNYKIATRPKRVLGYSSEWNEIELVGTEQETILNNIIPGLTYQCRVHACNEVGVSCPSDVCEFRLLPSWLRYTEVATVTTIVVAGCFAVLKFITK